jgi:hypothetical protein
VHVRLDVAATAPLYLLAPQFVHVAEPVASLYLPVTHPVHAPPRPLFPEYPALHAHAVTVLLPAADAVFKAHVKQTPAEDAFNVAEYVFRPQSVHAAEPVTVLYFPATHPKHGTPFRPAFRAEGVYPARHVQLVRVPLPAGDDEYCGQNSHWMRVSLEYLPATHVWHVSTPLAPITSENKPGPHVEHTVLPRASLYLPAVQTEHVAVGRPRSFVK